ncbi:MAG: hypothetical protein HZC41_03360 [Chloroflexi bacterium]|nr:hypothetical protein [Chloroflexota bacterium]
MGRSRWLVLAIVVLVLATAVPAARAQSVSLGVQAGYDGLFREDQWLPLYIQASNDGPAVEGRLVVRPETSGNAVINTYSLPISLPEGARKTAFLYITARSFATQVRVELMDAAGVVIAAQTAGLRSIQPQDQLYIVFSGATAGTVDLTAVHSGGYAAFQANWTLDNLPDRAAALNAVDMMLFTDIDTGALSTGQQRALADWVAQGGHLMVSGGPNWQATAAGLTDLLPLEPQSSTTLSDLSPLATWLKLPDTGGLDAQAVIASGTLRPDADILVDAVAVPLIVRHSLGAGTVDYLVFDPNTQPVRGWAGLPDLWFSLATTTAPLPGWGSIYNWDQAAAAANVMPGVNLLPDILPLCSFLAIYIALIGPLNYLILNRLNRRELAWLTIPLLIIVFSALSWIIGSNLRGSEVKVSRLTVVQSWPDAERARVQEMLGLLSPRRDQYTLAVFDNSFLRPVPRIGGQGSLLSGNVEASADVQQTDSFRAADFPVDASFIATFNASTTIEKPDISGQARLFYDTLDGQQILRGSVRNDTDQTLRDAVILARGTSLRLEHPVEPGDVVTFDLTLTGEELPAPARLAYAPGGFIPLLSRSYSYRNTIPQTLSDILQTTTSEWLYSSRSPGDNPQAQEAYRRRIFLSSFVNDPYNVTSGRGSRAFLAAWADQSPLTMELEGTDWSSLDTTLYLVELDVDIERPAGDVLISADQFTWTMANATGAELVAPFSIGLEPGDEATFRFTPLPEAVLDQVAELIINIDRGANISRTVPLQIWDWEQAAWDDVEINSGNQHAIRNPARYLGPQNAVQLRIIADAIGGYPRIQDVTVEQRGRF